MRILKHPLDYKQIHKRFLLKIQIQWKFCFYVILLLAVRLPQIFGIGYNNKTGVSRKKKCRDHCIIWRIIKWDYITYESP